MSMIACTQGGGLLSADYIRPAPGGKGGRHRADSTRTETEVTAVAHVRCLLATAVLACAGSRPGWSAPKRGETEAGIRGIRADQPPVIDGDLGDPVWRQGEWCGPLVLLTRNGEEAVPRTEFKLAGDTGNLYLAARLFEPEMAHLRASREQGGDIWKDDSLELFVDPYPSDSAYFQIAANSRGHWFSLKSLAPDGSRVREWRPAGVRAAAALAEREWTLELSVPLVSLGALDATDTWRVNVARNRTFDARIHTLASLNGSLHQPSRFATMTFPGGPRSPHRWELGAPRREVIETGPGSLWYAADIPVANSSGLFRFFTVNGVLTDGGREVGRGTVHGGLDSGLRRTYRLRIPVRQDGRGLLRLTLVDRARPDMTLQTDVFPVETAYAPVGLTVLRPAYRNSVYASHRLSSLRVRVDLAGSPESQTPVTVTVRVLDPQGKALDASVIDGFASRGTETVLLENSLTGLPSGSYTISAELHDGHETRKTRVPLTVHGPADREVIIDETGGVRIDGKPFLPVGWFTPYPPSYDEYASEGYTFLTDYGAPWRSVQEEREYLDQAAQRRLLTMIYPFYFYFGTLTPAARRRRVALWEAARRLRCRRSICASTSAVVAFPRGRK